MHAVVACNVRDGQRAPFGFLVQGREYRHQLFDGLGPVSLADKHQALPLSVEREELFDKSGCARLCHRDRVSEIGIYGLAFYAVTRRFVMQPDTEIGVPNAYIVGGPIELAGL